MLLITRQLLFYLYTVNSVFVYNGDPYNQTKAIGVGRLEFSKTIDGVPIHTEGELTPCMYRHYTTYTHMPSSNISHWSWAVRPSSICLWPQWSSVSRDVLYSYNTSSQLWIPTGCSRPLLASTQWIYSARRGNWKECWVGLWGSAMGKYHGPEPVYIGYVWEWC